MGAAGSHGPDSEVLVEVEYRVEEVRQVLKGFTGEEEEDSLKDTELDQLLYLFWINIFETLNKMQHLYCS